ncbi:hypothetical protein AB0C38_33020 [Amycolatopsis sp. NPDC048633]|uniref:hypothetical protein n=1 Tax=Amycolatopsis sp. NPDC048633 TaxID=3157095 RepID=UPI0033D973F3
MSVVGSLAVHAEESRPGGAVLRGDSPDVAVRCAAVFAWLMTELAEVDVAADPPVSGDAVCAQAAERLRRANA